MGAGYRFPAQGGSPILHRERLVLAHRISFDGLRFDAVHAITEPDWLDEMAAEVRQRIPDRNVHLVIENDDNTAGHLAGDFDAQWNDDGHHVLHRLLTGERQGYYEDYDDMPATRLARCLKEGSCIRANPR